MTVLPQPSHDAMRHSQHLVNAIRQEIQQAGGYISFARYMELALYMPGLGYYSAGSHKIGTYGDFITAPEISPVFALCLAKQCSQIHKTLGSMDILELGAGTGKLACDLLLALEQLHALPEHYYILEVSAEFKARQKKMLAEKCMHLLDRVSWLTELPQALTGIILANEVMDALPVHCFRVENEKLFERCVTIDDNSFAWHIAEPNLELKVALQDRLNDIQMPSFYESEVNLFLPKWIQAITACIGKGVILFLDYGYGRREYYHTDRNSGTLMCFYQHRRHSDPFKLVGLQDITAHVDFTCVAEAAAATETTIAGYTTQAAFLLACGLMEIPQASLTETERYQANQAIKLLTLPSQMGEIIKVMALSRNYHDSLLGFSLIDRKRDL
jgi:SAM-dependent MidA family methyltransferase